MNNRFTLLAVAIAASLSGCGSDSDNPQPSTNYVTLSGVAMDSSEYLSDKEVCLADSLIEGCTKSVATATTDSQGSFQIRVEEAVYYAMRTPILYVKANQIAALAENEAPLYLSTYSEQADIISPLSTKVTDNIRLSDPDQITSGTYFQAEAAVATNLNLTPEELNSDYIADNSADIIEVAENTEQQLVKQAELTAELNQDAEDGCVTTGIINKQFDYSHHQARLVPLHTEGYITKCYGKNEQLLETYATEEKWELDSNDDIIDIYQPYNWYEETKTWVDENTQKVSTLWAHNYYTGEEGNNPDRPVYDYWGEKAMTLVYSSDRSNAIGYSVFDEDDYWGDGSNQSHDCKEGVLELTLAEFAKGEVFTPDTCVDFVEENELLFASSDEGSTTTEKVQFFDTDNDPLDQGRLIPSTPHYYEERAETWLADSTRTYTKAKDFHAKTINKPDLGRAPFNEIETDTSYPNGNSLIKREHNNWWGQGTKTGPLNVRFYGNVSPLNWKESTEVHVVSSNLVTLDGSETYTANHYQVDFSEITIGGVVAKLELPYLDQNNKPVTVQTIEANWDAQEQTLKTNINLLPITDVKDVRPTSDIGPSSTTSIEYNLEIDSKALTSPMELLVKTDTEVLVDDKRQALNKSTFDDQQTTWTITTGELELNGEHWFNQKELAQLLDLIFVQDGSFKFGSTSAIGASCPAAIQHNSEFSTISQVTQELTFNIGGDYYVDIRCNATSEDGEDYIEHMATFVFEINNTSNNSFSGILKGWNWGANTYEEAPHYTREMTFTKN